MNENKFEVGNKIRFNYRGLSVTGTIERSSSDSILVGRDNDGLSFAKERIRDLEVLERAKPADTYAPGTVVRWSDSNSRTTPYRTAHKQPNGEWSHNGAFITWQTLLNKRPLTVLTETTVLE